jgi:hypothetical protein
MINNRTKNIFRFFENLNDSYTIPKELKCFNWKQSIDFQFQLDFLPTSVTVKIIGVTVASVNDTLAYELYNYNGNYVICSTFTYETLLNNKFRLFIEIDGDKRYYSENFCFNSCEKTTIQWSNSCPVGSIIYPENYIHTYNADGVIETLSSEVEEEAEENGFGETINTKTIIKQPYLLSFKCTEWEAQALVTLPLHDTILIDGLAAKNVLVTKESNSDNATAIISIQYELEQLLKTKCCEGQPTLITL